MILNIILGSLLFLSIISIFLIRLYVMKKYISRSTIVKKIEAISKKRGLFNASFNWRDDDVTTTVKYTVEFTVIDETQDMVKLTSGHIMSVNQSYTKKHHKEAYKESVEGNWFKKDDIRLQFFKDSKESIRDRKIEQLLDE